MALGTLTVTIVGGAGAVGSVSGGVGFVGSLRYASTTTGVGGVRSLTVLLEP
ncbi:MAG: hypothetical protein ACLS9T_09785 [Streptococcus salivarius]